MFLRIPKRVRAAAALVAVAAYALPLALGLLADAGHATQHVVSRIREERRVAAAFGVIHLGGAPAHVSAHVGFTHTHGGSTHTHDHATAALLRAAQQADESSGGPAHVAALELAGHVPGMPGDPILLAAVEAIPPGSTTPLPKSFTTFPLLRPPRA
jgi:hypothetical protein